MSIAIRAGLDTTQQVAGKSEKQHEGVQKSFQAGGLFLKNGIQDQILQKRAQARKQALKLVSDAWGKDTKAADDIQEMAALKNEKLSELNDIHAKTKNINESKKALQEEYGVAADSQEQKDLELLEKYQDNKNGVSYEEFSKEEIERLKQLQGEPLTEYQQKVLNLNNLKGQISQEADKKQYEIQSLTASISDASLEQLKSQGMLKAEDAAEQLMDAAEQEILGMLIQEGKENLDEKIEEEKKKAEETEEKQQEQEERIEQAKENRQQQEELIDGQQEANKLEQDISMQKQVNIKTEETQKSIQKILKDNHLLNEDIKGIEIDVNF